MSQDLRRAPHFASLADVARWLVDQFPEASPIRPCTIEANNGVEGGTPICAITVDGVYQPRAYFVAPIDVRTGKAGWATRFPDGRWAVIATRYRNSP